MAKIANFTTHWSKINSLFILAGIGWWMFTGQLKAIPVAGMISFTIYFMAHVNMLSQRSLLQNMANIVSGGRLLLTLALFLVPFSLPLDYIGIAGMIILLSDGLDGWLARKFKGESVFGAYMDMETDAFFILSLCVLIITFNLAGKWVLLPGLMRYLYVIIYIFGKKYHKKEPRSYRGQLIAVLLMLSLIFCFLIPEKLYLPILYLTTFFTLYSFLKDIRLLFVPEPSTLSNY